MILHNTAGLIKIIRAIYNKKMYVKSMLLTPLPKLNLDKKGAVTSQICNYLK